MPNDYINTMPGPDKAAQALFSDKAFNALLPVELRKQDAAFFTPAHIALKAAQWLTAGTYRRVLDIGAGAGKFCVAGAIYGNGFFYGIEHRASLVSIANKIIAHYKLQNAVVNEGNIASVSFSDYDAFYLYNPFEENLRIEDKLNDEIQLSAELYCANIDYTRNQLDLAREGARLVTYHGWGDKAVPQSFSCIKSLFNEDLKFWVKEK